MSETDQIAVSRDDVERAAQLTIQALNILHTLQGKPSHGGTVHFWHGPDEKKRLLLDLRDHLVEAAPLVTKLRDLYNRAGTAGDVVEVPFFLCHDGDYDEAPRWDHDQTQWHRDKLQWLHNKQRWLSLWQKVSRENAHIAALTVVAIFWRELCHGLGNPENLLNLPSDQRRVRAEKMLDDAAAPRLHTWLCRYIDGFPCFNNAALVARINREKAAALTEIGEEEPEDTGPPADDGHKKSADSADSADNPKFFSAGVPDDLAVLELVAALDSEKAKPKKERKSQAQLAREIGGRRGINSSTLERQKRRFETKNT